MRIAPGLSQLIVVGILLLAVSLGLSAFIASSRTLTEVGQLQAKEQLRLAALGARLGFDKAAEDLHAAARLLAQRPTLQALMLESAYEDAEAFLAQYRITGRLDLIQVEDGERVISRVGEAPFAKGLGLMVTEDGSQLWLARSALMNGPPGYRVRLMRRVDALLGDPVQPGLSLILRVPDWEASYASADGADTWVAEALARGGPIADFDPEQDRFMGLAVLDDWNGQALAVIEASLPQAVAMAVVQQERLNLALRMSYILLVVIALAILVGRHMTAPLKALTVAARRLGSGDLDTPIPQLAAAPRELSVLGETMEIGRERLRQAAQQREFQQRELAAQQKELDNVLAGVHDGVLAVDLDRRVTFANRAAISLLDAAEGGLVGRFCGDVLRPLEEEGRRPCEHDCPLLRARTQGLLAAVERCHGRHAGVRNLVLHAGPAQRERQVLILREQTPREAARHLRDAIVANLSHEFQTPLAAQLASIELLRDLLPGEEQADARRLVDSQHRAALRLSRLVDNLLESVRFESDAVRLNYGQIDIEDLLEEVIELLMPLFEQRSQRVEVLSHGTLGRLKADRVRIQQVLTNLLGNANKYAPDDTEIRVEIKRMGAELRLEVHDQGPGMPWLERTGSDVFARFVRGPAGDVEVRGSGLGLAIARAIIQAHGGRIEVLTADGPGAHLAITLPCNGHEDPDR